MSLYETALKIAVKAHQGQVRKQDDSPYVSHPIMVARLVEQAQFGEIIVAAALLHDVLEDTTVSEAELRAMVGNEVVTIVLALTEDTSLPWEARKEAYVRQVVAAGENTWAVSVADKIHNARDFISFYKTGGPQSWRVFNRGKDKKIWFERLLHRELSAVWQHPLLDQYEAEIDLLENLSD